MVRYNLNDKTALKKEIEKLNKLLNKSVGENRKLVQNRIKTLELFLKDIK